MIHSRGGSHAGRASSPAARTQENRRSESLLILGKVDLDTFERDGYVVLRGAVSAKVAEACRQAIWEGMGQRGIRHCDPATWPAVVELEWLDCGVFAEAGASPALAAACDALIGPQRWTAPIRPGGGGRALPLAREGQRWLPHRGQL